jgi:hypothetical protein
MTPEELLIELKSEVNLKVGQTLQVIYEVCEEQRKRGLSDFSFSMIARLGEGRGVPKAQSIRNKTGEPYRALIKCFEDNVGQKKTKNKVYKGKLDWIEEIKDVRLKVLAGHHVVA